MEKKKYTERIVKYVFISLIVSIIYAIVGIILSGIGKHPTRLFTRTEQDYALILLQCFVGLGLMFLPSILEHHKKFITPNGMHIIFVLFLYAAIILGEVHDFYHRFKHWDTLLHTMSGVMLGAFGFIIIDIFNNSKNIRVYLSSKFTALFSFCFALALGAIWEIYEFTVDFLFDLNMQSYALENKTLLLGRNALNDTMKDIIVDALGALIINIIGYIMIQKRKKSEKAKKTDI